MQETAGQHKYLNIYQIWVSEVEGCNLDVYMDFMEVLNDIEVPICRKNRQKAPKSRSFRHCT